MRALFLAAFACCIATSAAAQTARPRGVANTGITNVQAYGTDTTAVKAARDAASRNLFFPCGTYVINAPVVLSRNNMRLHGRGACSHVMLAAAASWAGRSITYAFQATSISNVEIDHLNFSCPVGRAHFGGGPAHILQMISVTKLSVHDNIADGCGDFLANIGGTDVTAYNNRVTNSDNACFDNWGGFTDSKVIRNVCSLMASSGSGVAGIWFTGTNTDGTAATSRRGTAIGNTIYVNTDNQVGIGLNATSGGVNTGHVVADNRIIVNAVSVFAILATGASECRITHNKIVGIGGVSGAAIRVARPATNCDVKDNLAVNWAKAGSGVFQYTGTTGTVSGNKCSGTCATLLGAFPSGVLHSANDNGAGTGRR